MPTPQEYLLSFDFTSFTSQFSILNKSFTDFGETIHKLASQVSNDLKGIQDQASELFQTFTNLGMVSESGFQSFERHLQSTSGYLEDYQKKSAEISQKLKDISNTDMSKLAGALGAGPESAADKTADINPAGSGTDKATEDMNKKIDEATEKTTKLAKTIEGLKKDFEEAMAGMWKLVEKEAKQAKAKAGGIFSSLTGGLLSGGGIIAMGLGFILLGKQEEYRKGAEAGEMLNVFEAGTAGVHGKGQEKAIEWMSKFQEKAQKLYGIGRQETQAVTKQMIDAGYKVTTNLGQFKNSLDEVGTNVMTTTLGIDKMYNMATGTSATNVNKLVSDYGESLENASQKYMDLAFAAQRSGMGVEKFIGSVMAGSQALSQYGVEMEDIKDVMLQLKGYYKEMGLTDQAAGQKAASSLQGMTGISSSGGGLMRLAAEMFPDMDRMKAMQKIEMGAERMAKGEDLGFFKDVTKAKIKLASEATRGNKTMGIEYLKAAGYYADTQSASAAWDIVVSGKIDSKEAADEATVVGQMKALKDSFMTESQQLTLLQKEQYNLMQGLGTIGNGLMKILSAIAGTLITGFYWLTSLPSRMLMSSEERQSASKKFDDAFWAQALSLESGAKDLVTGGQQAGTALSAIFGDMAKSLGPVVDLVKSGMGKDLEVLTQDVKDLMNDQKTQAQWIYTIQKDVQDGFEKLFMYGPYSENMKAQMHNLFENSRLNMEAYITRKMVGGDKAKGDRAVEQLSRNRAREQAGMRREFFVPGEVQEGSRLIMEGKKANPR
jgi:hypothetical protein